MAKGTDYIIAVFTRGRVNDQILLDSIPEEIRGLITLCCHPGEKEEHKKRWGKRLGGIIEYGKDCTNLGQARDWLMKYCLDNDIKYAIQIDDNVKFAARAKGYEVNFSYPLLNLENNFTPDEQVTIITDMLLWMLESLRSGYGVVGISHRSGNNRKKEEVEECTRLFAVWGISVKKYFKVGERFADNPFKEDFHMQLAFLTHGIPTCCNNAITFDKTKGANFKGGCSIYRNLTNVNKGSELLKEKYPDFVTLVEKSSGNWDNLGEGEVNRKEVIVHWKKAYEYGVKHKKS